MPATVLLLLAALVIGPAMWADTGGNPGGPSYSSASIVNAASNLPGPLAINTIVSLYGANLAYSTKGITAGDLQAGALPYVLANTGVRIWVNNIAAGIYYVSPTQVNFLVPAVLAPGPAQIVLTLDGLAGPAAAVTIGPSAPALFQLNATTIVAVHADGSPITQGAPAIPGEVVILFATGLGQTAPPVSYNEIATKATPILAGLQILVNGAPIDSSALLYAGLAPGFAGLYQINVTLPADAAANPEIRLSMGDQVSPPNLCLPLQPPQPVQ
jgi:uncharacterized protein (TIGR03437 family)